MFRLNYVHSIFLGKKKVNDIIDVIIVKDR